VLADDANARFRFGVTLLLNGIGVGELAGRSDHRRLAIQPKFVG
jgi:hypothetical protein